MTLEAFSDAARSWFEGAFDAPTPVQREGWRRIASEQHSLLIAPTGSGKTLAAFLWCIDHLGRMHEAAPPGVRVLYVSPLKALVHDIERNLRAPLVGIARAAERLDLPFRAPRVAIRTGDTPARDRRLQARDPAEILVTTPESLYLILGSEQRRTLATCQTIIVDEIHALAPTKRGAHLMLSLERVAAAAQRDPLRVGLSATARPLDEIARFLGGDRPVEIVDTSATPRIDLEISVPVPDLEHPEHGAPPPAPPAAAKKSGSILGELARADAPRPVPSVWPALYPRLLEEIRAHRSTIVFVNSRGLAERLCQRLNELAEEEIALAHHGSLAHGKRGEIEDALKRGEVRAIVATSSLELGIDMGAVDLVLLVESPGAAARGLQRVGRAGHGVGEISKGRIFPKHRGDLLEATVVAEAMRRGAVEPIRVPANPLDVLAQHIVAIAAVRPVHLDELERLVRRSASYRELSRDVLVAVLDMLAGKYPSTEFADLRPRLNWNRESDVLEARRGAGRVALLSGGTIPDRGLYSVHLVGGSARLGELDEEMVHETRAGQTITLGASTWRVVEITRDRVIVEPAPGQVGTLPFWRGEGPGRPIELGRAIGAFVRELGERLDARGERWLAERYGLDAFAARNLVDYLRAQREATGTLPTDRAITVERFRDELGDWRVSILSPYGSRVHGPWALALEARLSLQAGFEIQALHGDDGIVLRFADAEEPPGLEQILVEPEEIEELVVDQLGRSALFASQFRENAARALLLPRRFPGKRTPLWAQRLRSQRLQSVARTYPSFPIMLETYRACLRDIFDVPALAELLDAIRSRRVRVDEVETPSASPFARSLAFAYVAANLYEGDAPVAERRAQALTIDRELLRELLGEEELRSLLDVAVIESLEQELQGVAPDFRATNADHLADLLRRVGDLTTAEARERCGGDAEAWLAELEGAARAARVRIAGEERWIAMEDAALYRDALGVVPPSGAPEALLATVAAPLDQLLGRFARSHGPFHTGDVAARFGLVPAQVEAWLGALAERGTLLSGEFHPSGSGREWCDPDVLRRLRRRTLARLRDEVAPVEHDVLARFLPRWHGVVDGADGRVAAGGLDDALDQLEGAPLSFDELERGILPARVPRFRPEMLDERGALGEWVWVGRGALGGKDGRIALYRRERVALLLDPPEEPAELDERHRAILDHLTARGASFFAELARAAPATDSEAVLEALWDLVWAGLVTNDTFQALRALAAPAARRGRRGGSAAARRAAGRWSLVAELLEAPPPETRRAHARALTLLERYGVLSREAARAEGLAGGFASLYPVLREMEETGKIRRGHFVDGLTGAQFAFVGAVDQLRAARGGDGRPEIVVLAATDPAQPYGALLEWPPSGLEAGAVGPRRVAGASVVLANGEPALFVEKGARGLVTFAPVRDAAIALAAARALAVLAARGRGRRRHMRIERIDRGPAHEHAFAEALRRAGAAFDHKGIVVEAAVSEAGAPRAARADRAR